MTEHKNNKVVIIGASHAAAECVFSLRKQGFEGEILLIGDETNIAYQRPPLSKKYFSDEVTIEQLYIRPESMYAQQNIQVRLNSRVVKIDRNNKSLELDNGENINYDKLVLATGARVRKLAVDGSNHSKIHYLRSKSDVDKIKQDVSHGSRLLIVGAGYIGLEVAASAKKRACEVIVLEAMDRVLQRVTSPIVSDFYQKLHADNGVDIRLNSQLSHFQSQGENLSAILKDGHSIDFDCAIIGIGVVPNVELAKEIGLECENGIIVDEFTQTADKDIFAIGDCSNHPSLFYNRRLRLESVPNAMGQARTAASVMCGQPKVYDEIPWFWSDQYDVKLQTVGLMQGHDNVLSRGSYEEGKMTVFYLQNKKLIAVDALNSPADFMLAKKIIANKQELNSEQLSDANITLKSLLS